HDPRPRGPALAIHAGGDEAAEGNRAVGGDFVGKQCTGVEVHQRDGVDGDVQVGEPVVPAGLDGRVRVEHRLIERLGAAAPPRHLRGEEGAARAAAAALDATGDVHGGQV